MALEWKPPQDDGNTEICGYTVQKADEKTMVSLGPRAPPSTPFLGPGGAKSQLPLEQAHCLPSLYDLLPSAVGVQVPGVPERGPW